MAYIKEKRKNKDVNNKKGFTSDVLTLIGGTTFGQVVAILSAPILTRLYSPEDFGVWALFLSITGIIAVIACMRYEISIMLPESDEDAINLLGLSLLVVLFMTTISIIFIYFLKGTIVQFLNSPQLGIYLCLIPLFVLINGTFSALNYWNSRTKHFKRLSIIRAFSSFSASSTQIGSGLTGYFGGGGLIAGTLAESSFSTILLGIQIWKADKKTFKSSISLQKIIQGLKRQKKFPLIDSWSALLNTISWQMPAFLLTYYFSPIIVGFYSLGFRLLQLPMSFIGVSISQVFYQRASVAISEGNLDLLVENVFRVLVIVGMFPMLTLTIVGSDVFSVVFGQEWAEAGVYAQILSLWAFVWFISSPLSTIYVVMEKQYFGLQYNIFNFITRVFSLVIGGLMGNPRISIILFSVSGILVYGYLCLKMMDHSRVPMSRIQNIVVSNLSLFTPAGIILLFLKVFEFSPLFVVLISGFFVGIYYAYILKTDSQFNKIIGGLGLFKKLSMYKRY